ncbi:S-adenosyl-L-methionine-dependent methyltransferase [Melanogaster broomeanus]|nr:S-adenosyl-L-methionine-dependent methyltransferase [Melanogaster broomeanus]
MSIRFAVPPPTQEDVDDHSTSSDSDSEDYVEEDNNFEDWVSDQAQIQPCRSLFDDNSFPTVAGALDFDKSTHGFDLDVTSKKLKLDLHRRIRLINFIRKHKPTPTDVGNLTGAESFFSSDEYLIPVIEDDPLLQLDFGDDWSDDEALLRRGIPRAHLPTSPTTKRLVTKKLDISNIAEILDEPGPSTTGALRDDDTHYFQSYGYNDIHAVMIQDKVRTSSYASFILTNPILFRDAIVLDVGCGTASDIAAKAEKIVQENGLEDIITVIRGKVEEISLPDDVSHVDIIISEWMGYALLYESMLDSVLHARDRFLRPDGGVMAPSQCRIMLALCEGSEIMKDRVDFWGDVYGFDLSEMAHEVYNEAIVDVVGPDSVVSEPCLLKDLNLKSITSRQLDFTSPFTLTSTSSMHGDATLAEVWPVGGKSASRRRASIGPGLKQKEQKKVISFSTGPLSQPTHWKQTIFLLRDPILAEEGTVVSGTFYCKKSEENSRELDVEIHYSVKKGAEPAGDVVVQMYKVR